MTVDRPMDEHEGALFDAVAILIQSVVDLGADRAKLAEKFRENAEIDKRRGSDTAAAMAELFARMAKADRYYRATLPN